MDEITLKLSWKKT